MLAQPLCKPVSLSDHPWEGLPPGAYPVGSDRSPGAACGSQLSDDHEMRGKLSTCPVPPSVSDFLEWKNVRDTSTLNRLLFQAGQAGNGLKGPWVPQSQPAVAGS